MAGCQKTRPNKWHALAAGTVKLRHPRVSTLLFIVALSEETSYYLCIFPVASAQNMQITFKHTIFFLIFLAIPLRPLLGIPRWDSIRLPCV